MQRKPIKSKHVVLDLPKTTIQHMTRMARKEHYSTNVEFLHQVLLEFLRTKETKNERQLLSV
jgi:hypothetical protein